MGKIKILNPGFFTTIQDEGRFGYRSLGIASSGAMDRFSYEIANFLVGNRMLTPSLEMMISGPEIQFYNKELISICGGNLNPRINNKEVPLWTAIKVNSGDVLSFKGDKNGMVAYLSFAGGIHVNKVLNSYSTNIKGHFGGVCGRNLKLNDDIEILTNETNINQYINNKLPNQYVPIYKNSINVNVILGPQDDYFSKEEINKFLNETYEISPLIDRVGFRLSGKSLVHKKGSNIISDANNIGSIQVPGDGMPIILMNDCGTTGGYPKIASVIFSDLDKVAQLKPGDKIKFTNISLEKSHNLYKKYYEKLNQIKGMLLDRNLSDNYYNVKVNGNTYVISIEEQ